MKRAAVISKCGKYRYRLERIWNDALPSVNWIMLNPSTADAEVDDNTIRRVISFSQSWGFGSAFVFNLFALRTPDPKELLTARDPVGPENDSHLQNITGTVVAAWGTNRFAVPRAQQVLDALKFPLACLAKNQNGSPKHPLYVEQTAKMIPYSLKP